LLRLGEEHDQHQTLLLFRSNNLSIIINRVPTHTTPTSCTSQNTTIPMNEATQNFSFGMGVSSDSQ